jgi:hypothetical protein
MEYMVEVFAPEPLIPFGTIADLVLPEIQPDSIRVNGCPLDGSGFSARQQGSGVALMLTCGRYVILCLREP